MEFEALAQSLLGQIKYLLPAWLPGGKYVGNEYKCGSLRGGVGDSLSVNVSTGAWADFAVVGVRGGDLIALYAAINNLRQSEAFRLLSEKQQPSILSVVTRKEAVQPVAPPSSSDVPEMKHHQYGPPTAYWKYKDQAGNLLFYIARYDNPKCDCGESLLSTKICQKCGRKASKELMPWCWVEKFKSWRAVGWPPPRPIYGLEVLGDKPVMIVEGEKTCEAARKICGEHYTVITWPGGAPAVRKVDWTPLSGRNVVIWPDADEPGVAAAYGIARQLEIMCAEVKIIGIEGCSGGWDAADALQEGWDYAKFIEWAKPRVKIVFPVPIEALSPDQPKDQEAALSPSVYSMWERFGIAQNANGSPICNVDNVLRIFEGSPELVDFVWFDEFHKKYFTKWGTGVTREWSDIDELNMTAFFQRELGLTKISDEHVHKAAMVFAHRHKRNEPLDWLKSLVWDKKQRITTSFIDYFGGHDDPYVRAAGHNFWVSMVARVFSPGCKVDNMVILEGAQGKFKSTALGVIGGAWYSESHEMVGTPNFFQGLMGKMLVEISELDSFSKAETNTIKRVVSCATDRLRLPYARSTQDYPRQCIFVGTTNDEQYLRDTTGARRFWPIETHRIDVDGLKQDRVQLFAEAVSCLMSGESWHEMPEQTIEIQESRRQYDEWETNIKVYLHDHPAGEYGHTLAEIADKALFIKVEKLDRPTQLRLAKIMRMVGYKNKIVSRSSGSCRVWVRDAPF